MQRFCVLGLGEAGRLPEIAKWLYQVSETKKKGLLIFEAGLGMS
jgi:hypothetical protein